MLVGLLTAGAILASGGFVMVTRWWMEALEENKALKAENKSLEAKVADWEAFQKKVDAIDWNEIEPCEEVRLGLND